MSTTPTRAFTLLLLLGSLPVTAATAAAQRQFAERVSPHMPDRRDFGYAIAAADVDGDGDQDLVVGNNGIASGAQNRLYLGDGKGGFVDATATHLPAATHRTADLALGDVDGDGDLDLVTANAYQNRLYLNDGTGVFHDATFGRMPPDASDCRAVLLRDLDGDGDLDLVFAAYRQELLYLNDGTGSFSDVTASHMVVNQTSSWDIDAADIDGDGDLDLIVAEQSGHLLLLNDGTAHFTDVTAARLPPSTALAQATRFGDLDGDGDVDLVCGYWMAPPALYHNDGTGKFTDVTQGRLASTLLSCGGITPGDIDGDGDLDLVTHGWLDRYTPVGRVQLNDGAGKFTDVTATHLLSNATTYTNRMVLSDVDGDGDLDLAAVCYGQRDRLLFNEGNGVFVDATRARLYGVSDVPACAVLADLDGDGAKDLVFANVYFEWQSWPNRMHRNDGHGDFTDVTRTNLPADTDESRAVVCGDVDHDGDLDLVFGNFDGQNKLYLNDGAGVFTDVTATRVPAAQDATTCLALGDVDGDGFADLVVGNHQQQLRLYRNNQLGAFIDVTATRMAAAVHETRAVALGDVDGDGDLDLVVAVGLVRGAQNRLYLNDGAGTFTDATAGNMPVNRDASSCVALGDLDGDGDLDAVFGNDSLGTGARNWLYRNNGNGVFSLASLVYDLDNTSSVVLADVEEDGDLDVVFGNSEFHNKLYLNDGTGRFTDGAARMPGTLENTRTLVAGDIDGDGDIDLVAGNSGSLQLDSAVHANHLRQISAPRLPRIGKAWPVEIDSRAGFASAPQAAILFLGLVPASIALPPYGVLGLDPSQMITLPAITLDAPRGRGTLSVTIPPVPALVGLPLYSQAGVLPTPALSDVRLTNVLRERIGF